MDINKEEIKLLTENPGDLVVKYQPIVFVIVQLFMRSGYFKGEEKEEVVQHVNVKLLDRIDRIRMQYNGISLLRTYFSAIIRNICLELIRKGRRQDSVRLLNEEDHNLFYFPDQLSDMIIKQECHRLDLIMKMFYTERAKLVLCFKTMLRIPVMKADLADYCEKEIPLLLYEELGRIQPDSVISDREIYRRLSAIINYAEGKDSSVDSVRKYIWLREEEIIRLLNGKPPRAWHDHETFRILLDRYFYEKDRRLNRPADAYLLNIATPPSWKK